MHPQIMRKIILLILCLFFSTLASAQEEQQSPLPVQVNNWLTIYPGISISQVEVNITRNSDGQEAILSNDAYDPNSIEFDINANIFRFDFDDTNFGLTFHANTGTFSTNRQYSSINHEMFDDNDLGTSTTGYYAYFTPTIYYVMPGKNTRTQFGLGLGYGSTWFKGTAKFAPEMRFDSNTDVEPTNIDVKDNNTTTLSLTAEVFYKRKLFIRAGMHTVYFKTNEYKGDVTDLRLTVGVAFSPF